MRADEYVVNELLKTKNELDETRAANIFLREELRNLEQKYNKICSLFKCEQSAGNGYCIDVYNKDGYYQGQIIKTYENELKDIEPEFFEWLNALGLVLPVSEQELENDKELVDEAMKKAQELQAQQGENDD